jgi:hypothetical protein
VCGKLLAAVLGPGSDGSSDADAGVLGSSDVCGEGGLVSWRGPIPVGPGAVVAPESFTDYSQLVPLSCEEMEEL